MELGLGESDADRIEEVLRNLIDGTCDAVELIPLLEEVARKDYFYHFDDNGAGGMPHPVGKPSSFRDKARQAIENIEENQGLGSDSSIARSLKSLDTDEVKSTLEQLVNGNCEDETLIPILEKIAAKGTYDLYWRLGETVRKAIQRIRENIGAATCPLCGTIPDIATANTGRDEYFGRPITLLKRHELDRYQDLRECPDCGALFLWYDYSAQTGSGNNDEETLTRFSSIHAAVLRRIVHRAGGAIDDPAALARRLRRLPPAARELAAIHLRQRDRELARALVQSLAGAAAGGDGWSAKFVRSFMSTPEDAAFVLGVLDARPASSVIDELRKHARTVCCAICRLINTYPPTKARRDALPANLASLKRLGAIGRNDVCECPACDSLFHWQSDDAIEGGLTRVVGLLADALRGCIHRTAIDERAIETVFACGQVWQQLVFAYGMRYDPGFVMHLVPRMVSMLARAPQSWLHDALCEVARDPMGAARVLSAIAKLQRTSSPVESLAARARATLELGPLRAI